jgi:Holliday junction resolvase RusA-like endonuclease
MRITVYGKPITQGSKVRTRWAMRDANGETLHPWRDNVRSAALDALKLEPGFLSAPVIVDIRFTFARPNSHYGVGKNAGKVKGGAPPFPSSRNAGDIDKCARAILDALTDAGVFADDSQVVELDARKVWVGTSLALDRPGAVIDVTGAGVTVIEAAS